MMTRPAIRIQAQAQPPASTRCPVHLSTLTHALYVQVEVELPTPESPIPIETCRDLEATAIFVPATATECVNGIQLLAGICGCSSDSSSSRSSSGCLICPNGEVPKPDNHFYDANQMKSLGSYIDQYGDGVFIHEQDMFACKYVAVAFSLDVAPDSEECFVSQLRREVCGCAPHPKMDVLD